MILGPSAPLEYTPELYAMMVQFVTSIWELSTRSDGSPVEQKISRRGIYRLKM